MKYYKEKKGFLRRVSNLKVPLRYASDSLHVICQGNTLKDKLILAIYFLKIPLFFLKSLFCNKHLRELEEENKFLTRDVALKNKFGKYCCGNNILTVYIADDNYEKHLYPYLELSGGVFIDVGAHIGKYTIKLGRNPDNKIIAIEPEVNNYHLLEKNIELNQLKNVVAVNKGVFSAPGKLPFYIAGKGEGDHSVTKRGDDWIETTIEADALDNIIEGLNVNTVSLIKIDIEGAEVHALKGALGTIEKYHPKLLIEILKENKNHLEEITHLLKPFNYRDIIALDEDNYFFN